MPGTEPARPCGGEPRGRRSGRTAGSKPGLDGVGDPEAEHPRVERLGRVEVRDDQHDVAEPLLAGHEARHRAPGNERRHPGSTLVTSSWRKPNGSTNGGVVDGDAGGLDRATRSSSRSSTSHPR